MLSFVKTQALGNDFILLERQWIKNYDIVQLAPALCHRNFGIGSDGILIVDQEAGLYKMTMLNPDGSVAMCGNGLRSFVLYLYEHGLVKEKEFDVKSEAGAPINHVKVHTDSSNKVLFIEASMGEPILERAKIPFAKKGVEPALAEPIQVGDRVFEVALVSMGNPHAVIFVPDINAIDVAYWGPQIEKHPLFPQKTNVEFVQVVDKNNLIMRVWERGAGITLACGTGTTASVVASVLKGYTQSRVKVHLLGGILEIEYEKGKEAYQFGPAQEVFHGQIDPLKIKLP